MQYRSSKWSLIYICMYAGSCNYVWHHIYSLSHPAAKKSLTRVGSGCECIYLCMCSAWGVHDRVEPCAVRVKAQKTEQLIQLSIYYRMLSSVWKWLNHSCNYSAPVHNRRSTLTRKSDVKSTSSIKDSPPPLSPGLRRRVSEHDIDNGLRLHAVDPQFRRWASRGTIMIAY